MTLRLSSVIELLSCAAVLFAVNAAGQPPTHIDEPILTSATAKGIADSGCALAKDPLRCKARRKARDDCKGLRSAKRRQCLAEHPSPIDCSRSDNPRHCEAQQAAIEACRNKTGAQHRDCMRTLLK